MLNLLPNELTILICNNLDLKSINNLACTNLHFYKTINEELSNIIVINELKKINKNIKICDIYNFITDFCKIILYKNMTYKQIKNGYHDPNITTIGYSTNYLEKEKYYKSPIYHISYNKHVNFLFKDTFQNYILHGHLNKYNPIKVMFLYNFIQIEQFNFTNLNYYIDFIENITLNKFIKNYDDIILNYYKFIIYNLNYENSMMYAQSTHNIKYIKYITFDSLYKISKWIITPHIINKLLMYKPLNLENSNLLMCCTTCYKKPIAEIVNKKFDIRDDDLISYNYCEFKKLVKKQSNQFILTFILNKERRLVNKYITITDPVTNIKQNYSRSYISNINYNTSMIIKKNQNFLIRKIFNN